MAFSVAMKKKDTLPRFADPPSRKGYCMGISRRKLASEGRLMRVSSKMFFEHSQKDTLPCFFHTPLRGWDLRRTPGELGLPHLEGGLFSRGSPGRSGKRKTLSIQVSSKPALIHGRPTKVARMQKKVKPREKSSRNAGLLSESRDRYAERHHRLPV